MNLSEFVIGQISLLAWREGRRLSPGCRPAMLGIAHVIANRSDSGWHSGDWSKILNEVPVHASEDMSAIDWRSLPDVYDKDFLWLHDRVGRIYDHSLKDEVTSSADTVWAGHSSGPRMPPRRGLFYCNLRFPLRSWFVENIVRRPDEHPRQAEAGEITFYG